MFRAAELSGSSAQLHQIQNIVGDRRQGKAKIKVTNGNMGGSHVLTGMKAETAGDQQDIELQSQVLLSDIFQEVVEKQRLKSAVNGTLKRINVVLIIDIERFECRALLGSPG